MLILSMREGTTAHRRCAAAHRSRRPGQCLTGIAVVDTGGGRRDWIVAAPDRDRSWPPGSILEIKAIYQDPVTDERRQSCCYAISAKRYALYDLATVGMPQIPDDGYSEHGLGHLLNPSDPDAEDREWIRTIWRGFISEALGRPFQWPDWLDRPAMSRITASSPQVLRPLTGNRAFTYEVGPKPFNFLISPHVLPLGHPTGVDPEHFHLVAPYTRDARQWTKLRWTDIYSAESFTVTTRNWGPRERTAQVQSYGDVIARYRTHPERKSLGPDGLPCGRQTIGLLQRRPVSLGELFHIGKETNRMEVVEQGLVHDGDEVQLVFRTARTKRSTASIMSDSYAAPQPSVMKTCSPCGHIMQSARKTYCSDACRQYAYRQRKRYSVGR